MKRRLTFIVDVALVLLVLFCAVPIVAAILSTFVRVLTTRVR